MDNIFILTCGGLGDQVCAEPVVRQVGKMFPGKRVAVVGQPAFFEHLGLEVLEYETSVHADGETRLIRTFSAEEWGLNGNFFHPVDFISISTIKRTLTNLEKQIFMRADRSLVEKLGVEGRLLIHAGQTWENRTFPQEWWQEVVDLCSRSRKCALIGMDMALDDGYKRGFVRVDCPEGCVDLRGKTSIRELISLISANDVLSNDSFPIHIAGAFDNWIFVIPTVKHPDLLLPFRNGSQSYKTCCPLKRLMSEDVVYGPDLNPTRRLDFIPEGHAIMDYLPSPLQVLEAVTYERRPGPDSILWCR